MSANKAIASVSAKPRIAYPNNCLVSEGFRATELMSDPKTIPIPAPAPASAIVAHPAPINFAPSNMCINLISLFNACSYLLHLLIVNCVEHCLLRDCANLLTARSISTNCYIVKNTSLQSLLSEIILPHQCASSSLVLPYATRKRSQSSILPGTPSSTKNQRSLLYSAQGPKGIKTSPRGQIL